MDRSRPIDSTVRASIRYIPNYWPTTTTVTSRLGRGTVLLWLENEPEDITVATTKNINFRRQNKSLRRTIALLTRAHFEELES